MRYTTRLQRHMIRTRALSYGPRNLVYVRVLASATSKHRESYFSVLGGSLRRGRHVRRSESQIVIEPIEQWGRRFCPRHGLRRWERAGRAGLIFFGLPQFIGFSTIESAFAPVRLRFRIPVSLSSVHDRHARFLGSVCCAGRRHPWAVMRFVRSTVARVRQKLTSRNSGRIPGSHPPRPPDRLREIINELLCRPRAIPW